MMIDHVSTYALDFPKSRAFYETVMQSLGYAVHAEMVMTWDEELPNRRACAWGPGRAVFWLIEVKEAYTPRHLAFSAPDRASVDGFHAAALAAGGTDHGEPGPRPIYHEHYYGAFVLDPDGNNIEAVCHSPAVAP
jgi:catechol 2,3-dioxygenase-like lactoylglutathione lyase family enzyme